MKRFKVISLLLLVLLINISLSPINGPVYAQKKKKPVEPAPKLPGSYETITAAALKDYLSFIASDELEGRDTPSRGLDIAAKFIGVNLSRWGIKPGGDNGTFFQRIPLTSRQVDQAKSNIEFQGQKYSYGEDFLQVSGGGNFDGPLVFVGHGWLIKSKNINAYQDVDIKGKIVVCYDGSLPKGVSYSDITGREGEDWESPFNYFRTHGAKGVILVPDYQYLANWERIKRNQERQGQVNLAKYSNEGSLPAIVVSPKMLNTIFQNERASGNVIFNKSEGESLASFELNSNKQMGVSLNVNSSTIYTQNVMGILEGSDPVLKNEYVAVGAHLDHVGIGPAINGDNIYNGADDDGSGTVAVLSIAEAFAHGPRPKRSMLFIWHVGEEKGLWGSLHFVENPTVPIDKIITELNIDMIGRSRTSTTSNSERNAELANQDEIYVIGSKLMSTDLGEISETVNRNFLNINFNYKYDDPADPNRYFSRSDHFNYAVKGVPIIFYFDGAHEDYHRPSDSIEKIDYEKMEKVARTIFLTGMELANRPARPVVDKKIPREFLE